MTDEEFTEMRLWRHYKDKKFPHDTMYGFDKAIREIYASQHPMDCKKAKFLISPGHGFGFASHIHMEGTHLAVAQNLGRVLLRHPYGSGVTGYTLDVPYCKSRTNPAENITHECYYEPWSNCTINDIFPNFYSYSRDEGELLLQKLPVLVEWKQVLNGVYTDNVTFPEAQVVYLQLISETIYRTPLKFSHFARCYEQSHAFKDSWLSFPPDWWRAVAASFMVRPNRRTLELLSHYTQEGGTYTDDEGRIQHYIAPSLPYSGPRHYPHSVHGHNSSQQSKHLKTEHPHDLNTRALQDFIGIYIRHGDKWREMRLKPFEEYEAAARYLRRNHVVNKRRSRTMDKHSATAAAQEDQRNSSHHFILIGTDDPTFFNETQRVWTNQHDWRIFYTNLLDRWRVSANDIIVETDLHHDLEYISMILNLDLSLHATSWICTMQSNSCLIVDELRFTIARKADLVAIDLQKNRGKRWNWDNCGY